VTLESKIDLKEVIGVLKAQNTRCSSKWQKVKIYDTDAHEFLSFSKEDLKENSERGRVNALSNANRAIACRIDELLTLFNLKVFSNREGWNMPYKMNVLQTLGIPALSVLKHQITSKRNLLDHEYSKPNEKGKEIQDIVDIAELFLKTTDQYIKQGYITHATIHFDMDFDMLRKGTKKGDWRHGVGTFYKYEITFDLANEAVTLTHLCSEEEWQWNMETGEIKCFTKPEMKDKITKRIATLSVGSCSKEDIREMMTLLRGKGE
jgi:hypothetical protein